MSLKIQLDDTLENEVLKTIKTLYTEAITTAREDVGIYKEFLTLNEACEVLDVSKSTFIRNFIDEGLPTFKIGTKIYVDKKQLNTFIRQNQIN